MGMRAVSGFLQNVFVHKAGTAVNDGALDRLQSVLAAPGHS